MKVAVVYNRESKSVINLFGTRSREKYGLKAIGRIVDSLKKGGHQVLRTEGDKDLIRTLEDFMPRVLSGERPGMVLNLSYGIQGQARYTHVPGILEMIGIPYVGSGPLAHSLALDKVVAKMIFRQNGIPTPDFAVLTDPTSPIPSLTYPLIVKPKNESTSFGLKIVQDEAELREAVKVIFDEFNQSVLVEQYIDGREVNVGILGNEDPVVMPPAELIFGEGGPKIYTLADKRHKSGRTVDVQCPADISEDIAKRAQAVSLAAFQALGCADCARVDLRVDDQGNVYVLEINSLPSLGEHGSYTQGAQAIGLDFAGLVNRLIEVAATRYFGTPSPKMSLENPQAGGGAVFEYVTAQRDRLEQTVELWTNVVSRTEDPVGLQGAFDMLDQRLRKIGLRPGQPTPDPSQTRLWETNAGFAGGTLVLGHVDVPLPEDTPHHRFRRDPEVLHGEGIASSRAALAMLETSLRYLKSKRQLDKARLGVLYFGDEGLACRQSAETIGQLSKTARRVLVLHPGTPGGQLVVARRGLLRLRLTAEAESLRIGTTKQKDVLTWAAGRIAELQALTDRKRGVAVSVTSLRTSSHRGRLAHRVVAEIAISFTESDAVAEAEARARTVLGKKGPRWELKRLSVRPAMPRRSGSEKLASRVSDIAEAWKISQGAESSLQPSAAGLVTREVEVLCGLAPTGQDVDTPNESIARIGLVQRTLLFTHLLADLAAEDSK